MKRKLYKIITVSLAICFLLLNVMFVRAESEKTYGVIKNCTDACDDWGNPYVMLQIYKSDGTIDDYACDITTEINGKTYDSAYEMTRVIPINAFAEFVLDNEKICELNYDSQGEQYNNITYNVEKKCFNGIDKDVLNLPIYYKYADKFVQPTLDENHIYNIELYKYAIFITSFKAINKPLTINEIEITDTYNSRFKKVLCVGVYFDNSEAIVKVQLLDSDENVIGTKEISCASFGEVSFDNIPNENACYTIKICLSDNNGKMLSHIYTRTHQIKQAAIISGVIKNCTDACDDWGNPYVMFRIYKSDGTIVDYTCDITAEINGKTYDSTYDMTRAVKRGSDVKFTLNENADGYAEITALTFGREIIDSVACERDNNELRINVVFVNLNTKGTLCAVVSDDCGVIKDVKYIAVTSDRNSYELKSKALNGYKVKVFLFDGKSSLKPLAESVCENVK